MPDTLQCRRNVVKETVSLIRDLLIEVRIRYRDLKEVINKALHSWTGLGCDLCGFGTVDNIEEFSPFKPCPDCGIVTVEVVGDRPIGDDPNVSRVERDQIKSLASDDPTSHLDDPYYEPEECYGPVPPKDESEPNVSLDPFNRDWGLWPSPHK